MPTPIHFMVEHQNKILDAFHANHEKPKKTWARLLEILPELSKTMQFNTFKQYVRVFAVFAHEFDRVRQELATVRQKLSTVKQKLDTTTRQNRDSLTRSDNVGQDSKKREGVIQRFDKTQLHQVGFDKVIQDLARVIHQLDKTKKQNQDLLAELTKVRQSEKACKKVIQKFDKPPKRISEWSVQKSKDGYFRCYRKIEGRVHCVYIGKDFDVEKARKRIMEKEKTLGLPKQDGRGAPALSRSRRIPG